MGAAEIPCICARLRMATRAVTRVYDEALRPTGLRTTQFSILARLSEEGGLAVGELGARLVMDRTTVARELAVLARRGLVELGRGDDRRRRLAALTPAGREAVAAARPLWRTVQDDVTRRLGADAATALLGELDGVVGALAGPGVR